MRLCEIQSAFCRAVLAGDLPQIAFAPGRVPASAALLVHRNTVIGGAVNALRLIFPTVDALVGEAFFDRVAIDFIATHPPRAARLSGYGAALPEFVAQYAPTAGLPYLPDVARLDFAIDGVLHSGMAMQRFALNETVSLDLPQSLTVLCTDYPADQIRAAIGDDAALSAVDVTPMPRRMLVWRSGSQAVVRAISVVAGTFLETLLAGAGAEAALAAAAGPVAPEAVIPLLQHEIFAAPFCQVISETMP